MASDYEAITRENIRRRGEEFDDIGRLISERFYSDQTHFIYELLQNAEDALRRRHSAEPGLDLPNSVTFRLYADRLEIRHYGQPFTYEDVVGISDILRGTKADDPEQIGKFGIGFKSVYAFTSSPEIHSGDEHFRIEGYIRPITTAPRKTGPGETVILLPFNHRRMAAEIAYSRIFDRLSDLGIRTLLFLSYIDQITWEVDDIKQGSYRRDTAPLTAISRRVSLTGEKRNNSEQEHWIVFVRQIENSEIKGQERVEIAYLLELDRKANTENIVPITSAQVYVYFPTEQETHLRFLIQGPYNTTPSRDFILKNDPRNETLIRETAQLVVDSLLHFQRKSNIDLNLLLTMPIQTSEFSKDSVGRPIYDEVRRAFEQKPLLPAFDGTFVSANQAKLSRTADLRQLLSTDVLPDLFGENVSFTWLSDDITIDRAPELRKYLMDELKVEEIDPEKFAYRVSLSFLQKRSDEWMIQLYKFLDGQKALWRQKEGYYRQGILREKPILRLEGGGHVPPFDSKGLPNAYLPPEEQTDFPSVHRAIAKDKDALLFLQKLGLQEPDIVAEVMEKILPKYKDGHGNDLDYDEHIRDIKKIVKAFTSCSGERKKVLLKVLQEVMFLRAYNAKSAEKVFQKPHQIHIGSDELELFLGGNPSIWFLDYVYVPYIETLRQIGVEDRILLTAKRTNSQGYVTLVEMSGWHKRGVAGFDPDASIEGLDFAVHNPTLERSQFIWNRLLIPNSHLIQGVVESSGRQTFERIDNKEEQVSSLGKLVLNCAWLPNTANEYHIPCELSLDDLPEGFVKDDKLARQLNMKTLSLRSFAEDEGIDETDLALIIQAYRSDPKAMRTTAAQISQGTSAPADKEPIAEDDFNYRDALTDVFSRPGKNHHPEEDAQPVPEGKVENPELRRERTRLEIKQGMAHEPVPETRFKKVNTTVWEAKDNQVREFLHEQYHGRCQICGISFPKRDGNPYFEGVYLVSYTRKQWIDRPGNVLCLCANCCAKFQHGEVEAEDIDEQILGYKTYREGGKDDPALLINLCGEAEIIRYTEKHLLDLQEIIRAAQDSTTPTTYI